MISKLSTDNLYRKNIWSDAPNSIFNTDYLSERDLKLYCFGEGGDDGGDGGVAGDVGEAEAGLGDPDSEVGPAGGGEFGGFGDAQGGLAAVSGGASGPAASGSESGPAADTTFDAFSPPVDVDFTQDFARGFTPPPPVDFTEDFARGLTSLPAIPSTPPTPDFEVFGLSNKGFSLPEFVIDVLEVFTPPIGLALRGLSSFVAPDAAKAIGVNVANPITEAANLASLAGLSSIANTLGPLGQDVDNTISSITSPQSTAPTATAQSIASIDPDIDTTDLQAATQGLPSISSQTISSTEEDFDEDPFLPRGISGIGSGPNTSIIQAGQTSPLAVEPQASSFNFRRRPFRFTPQNVTFAQTGGGIQGLQTPIDTTFDAFNPPSSPFTGSDPSLLQQFNLPAGSFIPGSSPLADLRRRRESGGSNQGRSKIVQLEDLSFQERLARSQAGGGPLFNRVALVPLPSDSEGLSPEQPTFEPQVGQGQAGGISSPPPSSFDGFAGIRNPEPGDIDFTGDSGLSPEAFAEQENFFNNLTLDDLRIPPELQIVPQDDPDLPQLQALQSFDDSGLESLQPSIPPASVEESDNPFVNAILGGIEKAQTESQQRFEQTGDRLGGLRQVAGIGDTLSNFFTSTVPNLASDFADTFAPRVERIKKRLDEQAIEPPGRFVPGVQIGTGRDARLLEELSGTNFITEKAQQRDSQPDIQPVRRVSTTVGEPLDRFTPDEKGFGAKVSDFIKGLNPSSFQTPSSPIVPLNVDGTGFNRAEAAAQFEANQRRLNALEAAAARAGATPIAVQAGSAPKDAFGTKVRSRATGGIVGLINEQPTLLDVINKGLAIPDETIPLQRPQQPNAINQPQGGLRSTNMYTQAMQPASFYAQPQQVRNYGNLS